MALVRFHLARHLSTFDNCTLKSGLSEPRGPCPPIFEDQLTLFQQGMTDYARHITTSLPSEFSDLPAALKLKPLTCKYEKM